MNWKHIGAIVVSFARSFVLGATTLVVNQGWGLFESGENWRAILDAGFVALALTVYLFFDNGFTQYGVGSEYVQPQRDVEAPN